MSILVTGSAGFIGYHVCHHLLTRGETVIGIDNLNSYYDVGLKEKRLSRLKQFSNFQFELLDISEQTAVQAFAKAYPTIEHVIHLAAQAGVRYSLTHPLIYASTNVMGQMHLLEACKTWPLKHFVYASSSSVYGANQKLPFSVDDPVDQPMSVYAATKRADELLSYTYSHLFKLPSTGLRFFTVYGPWGRPDMAAFLFTDAILNNKPVVLFNQGNMRRNFTYIDDIVQGVLACLDKPPQSIGNDPPHALYNLGNSRSESLTDFLETLETLIGQKATIQLADLQPGDVPETIADITATQRAFGFEPKTHIQEGLAHFVKWYKEFYDHT